ncbi:MAG TPA: LacI family transcriptional regulator [Candidatus Eisenbergiella intestinipullorum]|nr:LacI family transcriptional regulator [Candidatus Eisenbergiella intestinipullorum]
MYDISRLAGVSIATVSRVLNGSDKVSESTRKKVLDVMERSGYTPNAFARGLGLNTMRTVGILCADSSDIYLARVIYWLERELRKNSYASMLCCTGYHLPEKEKYLQLLLSRSVDALILAGSQFIEENAQDNAYLYEAAKKVPVFLLNGVLPGSGAYSIVCDDALAVKEMTDELIALGCRSPIFLYRSLSYSGKRKLSGFCRSLTEHGMNGQERSFLCPAGIPETVRFLQELEAQGIFFDGCLASDDELAVGAVKYALEAGRQIPADLQITGYNNSLLSLCSTPEITTADNRSEFLCTTAVSLLMQVLEGKDVPERTMYSANLIRRATTRSPK